MTKTSRNERKNRWWLYLLVISSPFLALALFAGYRLYSVMGLQKVVAGSNSVIFANSENPNSDDWSNEVIDYLGKKAEERGIEFSWSSKERCRAVLLSRIDAIALLEPGGFAPEFGTALARFSHLQAFELADMRETLGERDIAILLTALRRMERLEEIGLLSGSVTDRSFATLAGHPSLSKVTFGPSSITPEVAATLKTLPNLKEVTLIADWQRHHAWTEANTQQAFRDALPGVKIEFEAVK